MDKYTLFYSWQSDSKDKSRSLIEKALKDAVDYIKKVYKYEIIIDHSTINTPGMQSINQTILNKIDKCDIFLCDLTPVDSYEKKEGNGNIIIKQVPNPNVLIELGYAMSVLGIDYIIPVAHLGKWSMHEMPFDINHNRLLVFNSSNCDFRNDIVQIVDFIKKNGKQKRIHSVPKTNFFKKLYNTISNIPKNIQTPKTSIRTHSTSFFSSRIAEAFPGKRGLVEYTKQSDIKRALLKLLKSPLFFEDAQGFEVASDPIWWFRSGSALNIESVKHLSGNIYLLGSLEIKVKRIVAYIDYGIYYKNYVYVETDDLKPTSLNKDILTPEHIKSIRSDIGYASEEYAIFRPYPFIHKLITREEEDDGHTTFMGNIVPISGKYEHRTRILTRYNYVICAKHSPFNSTKFDCTSEELLDGLLDNTISIEQFNDYMLSFNKDDYH